MLRFFWVISCAFISPFIPLILSASHLFLNTKEGRIEALDDSPYLIKRPHSLDDLFQQVDWVEELAKLKASIKEQQAIIEKRYDEDDPELELKIRQTDPDCIRSEQIDLHPKFFTDTYPINLVFVQQGSDDETPQMQPRPLIELFERSIKDEELPGDGHVQEPDCEQHFDIYEEEETSNQKQNAELNNQYMDIPEPGLNHWEGEHLSEKDLQKLANFLTRGLTHTNLSFRELSLYMSHFYWRFRGKTRKALKCLHIFLQVNPENIPAKLQFGLIMIKLGNYPKAIEFLEIVNQNVENCAICSMILGDAYTLNNNLAEAEQAFNRANELEPNHLTTALKKASLIRCTVKLVDAMQRQHKNLLDTIDDVEDFKTKMIRIEQLERLIEGNRAPPEARLQAKLTYEHYEYGPLPYAYCRDAISWVGPGKRRKRLYCTVSNWNKYNESLEQRKREKTAQKEKEESKNGAEREKARRENEERQKARESEEAERTREWEEYSQKLKPFVGMTMDEPQMRPKYPLEKQSKSAELPFFHPIWPSLEECKEARKTGKFVTIDKPGFFISPQNKGYLVTDLMTKYLALNGPTDFTPLPWELPYCSLTASNDNDHREFSEKLAFIGQLETFNRLKSGGVPPSDEQAERGLKDELYRLVGFDPADVYRVQQPPLISEIGERIANLINFDIGPKWLVFNLAALYFRYLGIPAEAVKCLDAALKFAEHEDIALTQLAQILQRNIANLEQNREEINGLERILNIAMEIGLNEPIPYHLLAIFHSIRGHSIMTERFLLKALHIDPYFSPSLEVLLNRKCTTRMDVKMRQVHDVYQPICCWPNEQEIYCFDEWTRLKRRRIRCYILETKLENSYQVNLVYFRCNTPYTGRSYVAPAYAKFMAILLKPSAELRAQKEHEMAREMEEEFMAEWNNRLLKQPEVPVFPLDYGGYSLERIKQHQRPIWPEGVSRDQLVQSWIDPDYQKELEEQEKLYNKNGGKTEEKYEYVDDENGRMTEEEEEEKGSSLNLGTKSGDDAVNTTPTLESELSDNSNDDGNYLAQQAMTMESMKIDTAEIGRLQSRSEVVHALDIPLPKNLPVPSREMIEEGKRRASQLKRTKIAEICHAQKKSSQLLEQPVSTWVSPTAKGVKVEDVIDMDAPLSIITGLEPECPEPALALESDSILLHLDQLPAYLYRHHLTKFYKPEKALRDTFRAIGGVGGGTSSITVEQMAARLFFAIKSAQTANDVHWALSTLSSLYWRIKGDPVNAIKCLRHSLQNSPEKFKDVPLVSLANIYHQAGFLHSALFTLGKALETGQDVVAVHFTLANVYATIGDFPHALQFYHSTLALQSKFEPANVRIASIHCLTHGELLDD